MDPMSTTDADLPAPYNGYFDGYGNPTIGYTPDQLRAALASRDAELAKLRQGEPVAWLVHTKDRKFVRACWTVAPTQDQLDAAAYDGDIITPCCPCASNPPAQPTQAEPSDCALLDELVMSWAKGAPETQAVRDRRIAARIALETRLAAQPPREPVQPLSDVNWMPFGLTVAAALDRGDDARMLFDENSPLRDELRRLIQVERKRQ